MICLAKVQQNCETSRKKKVPNETGPLHIYTCTFISLRMAECEMAVDNFIRTGRTGRRNALPDVFAVGHANVSTAGLPEVLENFTISSSTQPSNGTSGSQNQPQPEKME